MGEKEVYARHLEFESRAKLKATSTTSGLLAGFAMINMIELQIEDKTPEYLLILFSTIATLLVCVHVFALLISTCILPNLEVAVTQSAIDEDNTHKKMAIYIEISWILSTTIGIFLFIIEMCVQCWIKFWTFSKAAAIASTVVAVPTCLIFIIFAMLFYDKLIAHKAEEQSLAIKNIETIAETLTSMESLDNSSMPSTGGDSRRDSGGLTFAIDDYRASPRVPVRQITANRNSLPISYSPNPGASPAPSPGISRVIMGTGGLQGSHSPSPPYRGSLGQVKPGLAFQGSSSPAPKHRGSLPGDRYNRQNSSGFNPQDPNNDRYRRQDSAGQKYYRQDSSGEKYYRQDSTSPPTTPTRANFGNVNPAFANDETSVDIQEVEINVPTIVITNESDRNDGTNI